MRAHRGAFALLMLVLFTTLAASCLHDWDAVNPSADAGDAATDGRADTR